MISRIAICIFSIFFLVSCASTGQKKHEELQKLIRSGQLDKALELVQSDSFYPEKTSELLRLMELGMLNYHNQNFYQAIQSFDKAKEVSDKLFTVSLSKKALTAITNDSLDNYYGEKYERSMIRFYQLLTHLALSESLNYESYEVKEKDEEGKVKEVRVVEAKELSDRDRRFHLTAARSVLLEWNALLDSYKATSGGKATYKDDLLAKVFGAFVHEKIGTTNDVQIARGLYNEAKKILLQNFSIYNTYNLKNKEFLKKFSDLHKMPIKEVEANFIEKTAYYKELESFIDQRLKNLSSKKKDNVYFLVSNNFVEAKVANKFDFPLPVDSMSVTVGTKADFISFTTRVLSSAKDSLPKIYFELPMIPYNPVKDSHSIVIKNGNGEEVHNLSTVLVNPLSEIAYKALDEESIANMAKVGTRVAAKHLAALGAAYLVYDQAKDKGDFVAITMATLSYSGANKLIEASEKADLRFWSTLPSDYRITSISLPAGSYTAEVNKTVDGKTVQVAKLEFVVKDDKQQLLPVLAI